MGRVGRDPDHCLELSPRDPSSAVLEKVQACESKASEQASTTSKETLSPTQAPLNWKAPPPPGEEGEVHSESSQSKARPPTTLTPPVIKVTNMQDGSVQYISNHATHSAVMFQNPLLYELD